jgi:hypothetical protein
MPAKRSDRRSKGRRRAPSAASSAENESLFEPYDEDTDRAAIGTGSVREPHRVACELPDALRERRGLVQRYECVAVGNLDEASAREKLARRARSCELEQPRLFAVDVIDRHVWPRRLAITLTIVVWLTPTSVGLVAATVTHNWFVYFGATAGWIPWTWATPKLVRFMITGVEGWDPPREHSPTLRVLERR